MGMMRIEQWDRSYFVVRVLCLALLWGAASLAEAGKSGANQPPSVQLTSPANGASFVAPASIALSANASDPNGAVTRVDFYQGNTLIGTATAAPYTAVWSNVGAGSYTLTAKATDNAGAVTTSAGVSVMVTSATALTITGPVNGASLNSVSPLTVTGTFEGPSGSTVLVDNEQSTVWATINGNAYTAAFSYGQKLAIGPNTITVRLARPDGTSASRAITVNGYDNPQIVFTGPACDTFDAPANIVLAADAIVPGGAVTQVQFSQGNTLLATIKTPPYQYNWTNVGPGTYSVTARATSSFGETVSVPRQIRIIGTNTPPTVTLTAPAAGSAFTAPASVSLAVNATDPDAGGAVRLVEYFANGTLIAATNVPPFGAVWSNVAVGSYTVTARATDDRNGQTTSSPVSITVGAANQAPVVSLTAPAPGATFTAPATIPLAAEANDPDGTIARVEFYQGTTLLGTVTSAPYVFNWTNAVTGDYSITARATDNGGASTTSLPVSVRVNAPAIEITNPLNGAVIEGDEILVVGRVNASALAGIHVNGVPAFTDQNGNFYANNVPLREGSNSVVATLTHSDGTVATYPISLTSSGAYPIRILAEPLEGGVPLVVSITIGTTEGASLDQATYDFEGDGNIDHVVTGPSSGFGVSYPNAGIFLPVLTATDSRGRMVTRRFAVRSDPNQDLVLRSTFNTMLARLRSGDISGALQLVTPGATAQYEELFTALRDAGTLTAAIDSLGVLRGSTMGPGIAELILSRETAEGTEAYPILFLQGSDGIWRIESM